MHGRRKRRGAVGSGQFSGRERLVQVLAGLLLCLVVTSCAMAPSSQPTMAAARGPIAAASSPEMLDAGTYLYQRSCAPCHGEEGRSGIATPLDQHGHAWHHPDSVLIQTIREGTIQAQADLSLPDLVMPPFEGILTLEEIRTLIASFKASWTPDQQRVQWDRTVRADFTVY